MLLELLVSAPFELVLLVEDVSPFFFDFDEVVEVPLVSLPMVPDVPEVPEVPLALSVPVEPVEPDELPDVPSELSLPEELPVEPEVEPELEPVWVTPEPVTPLLFGDGVAVPPVCAITGQAARERADAP
ncbi:MAG TPA: hypothetical protein VGH20_22750 [Myxococcales bacterium]